MSEILQEGSPCQEEVGRPCQVVPGRCYPMQWLPAQEVTGGCTQESWSRIWYWRVRGCTSPRECCQGQQLPQRPAPHVPLAEESQSTATTSCPQHWCWGHSVEGHHRGKQGRMMSCPTQGGNGKEVFARALALLRVRSGLLLRVPTPMVPKEIQLPLPHAITWLQVLSSYSGVTPR